MVYTSYGKPVEKKHDDDKHVTVKKVESSR